MIYFFEFTLIFQIISDVVVASSFSTDNTNSSDEKQNQIEKLEKTLKLYQEKLLQVDKRNRSVQFKKIFAKHNFDLVSLEEFD